MHNSDSHVKNRNKALKDASKGDDIKMTGRERRLAIYRQYGRG